MLGHYLPVVIKFGAISLNDLDPVIPGEGRKGATVGSENFIRGNDRVEKSY